MVNYKLSNREKTLLMAEAFVANGYSNILRMLNELSDVQNVLAVNKFDGSDDLLNEMNIYRNELDTLKKHTRDLLKKTQADTFQTFPAIRVKY